jgi:hypothetical protein
MRLDTDGALPAYPLHSRVPLLVIAMRERLRH